MAGSSGFPPNMSNGTDAIQRHTSPPPLLDGDVRSDADALVATQSGGARPASLAALFGDDKDPQPLWLEKEAFMEKDFDCEAYIANVRRFVPLETVRTELKRHVAALKSELVELINRDYNDFVNLSTKLVDVDGAVLRMRVPLSELRTQLLTVREGVAAAPAALQDGLRRRAEAANARQILELLLDTSNVLSKVEKLLLELQSLPGPTSEAAVQSKGQGQGQGQGQGEGEQSQEFRGTPEDMQGRVVGEGIGSNGSAHGAAGSAVGGGAREQQQQQNGHMTNGDATRGAAGDGGENEEEEEEEEEDGEGDDVFEEGLSVNGRVPRGGSSKRSAGEELEEGRSRLLERIGSEMNRLKFYVTKGQDLPFVRSVEKRISAADEALASHLSSCLERGLLLRQRKVVYHCLRSYSALDNASAAEDVFRRVVVSARVSRALEMHHQQQKGGRKVPPEASSAAVGGAPKGASSEAVVALDLLENIYEGIKEEVVDDCKFISSVVSSADAGLHGFQFLAGGVLKEVNERLHESRPSAFSAGRPAQFLLNYCSSLKFLDFLEGFCSSEATAQGFRAHPSYEEFMRSWNLAVYFRARFLAIAGMLDEALAPPPPQQAHVHGAVRRRSSTTEQETTTDALPPPPPLALHSSLVLYECLFRCWSPDVLLPSISHQFLLLTLQLLSRYCGWVKAGIGARQSGSATEHLGGEWGLAATPDDFLAVWHDLGLLSSTTSSSLVTLVFTSLGPLASQQQPLQAEVSEQLLEASKQLQSLGTGLANVVSDVIGERCIEVLRPVRAIAAMYRVPSRPPPVRHSHYVAGILQPLKAALSDKSGEAQVLMTPDMRSAVVRLVLEKTTARFHELAREVVATAKRTESSLRLLQQRSMRRPAGADASGGALGGGSAGGAAFSDTDKIILQLFLDVQEFASHVRAFGVEPVSMQSFVALWQCVAPPDRQNIDI